MLFVCGVIAPVCALAWQVGDVTLEYDQVEWSETDRFTCDDVEYLYTFKGVQHYVDVVTKVDEYGIWGEIRKDGPIETQFVIEKATPLTGNYDISISLYSILCNGVGYRDGHYGDTGYYYGWWEDDGYHSTNYLYAAADTIVIGDSCFEDNELVTSVTIVGDWWDDFLEIWADNGFVTISTDKNLAISKRAFYGATNLRYVGANLSVKDDFDRIHLVSVDESAFENCENLKIVAFDCQLLKTIEQYAFYGCYNLVVIGGDVYYGEGVSKVDIDGWVDTNVDRGQGVVRVQYNWHTPRLKKVGDCAFYGAGNDKTMDEIGILKWKFDENDVEFGDQAFYGCVLFQEIIFPSSMKEIPESSFCWLHGSVGILPNGMYSTGHYSTTRIKLPEQLVSIGAHAFACALVTIEEWPKSLKTIGACAFSENMSLIDVNSDSQGNKSYSVRHPWNLDLPDDLTDVGFGAFDGGLSRNMWSQSGLSYDACGPIQGSVNIPTLITNVPPACFRANAFIEQVVMHTNVMEIGNWAFQGCSRLSLTIPSSVVKVGLDVAADYTLNYHGGLIFLSGPSKIVFEGCPPSGLSQSGLMNRPTILVPVEYAAEWVPYMNERVKLAKKVDGEWLALGGSLVSAKIRDGVPNVMDITYRVTSIKPTAKVRLVAFKDGGRSFANVTVPATFVADTNGVATAGSIGDAVVPNMEHTVSWQVSSDWGDVKLAKISVEVFVMDDELLPLQLMTLPANETRGKLTFSTNQQSAEKITNALYWLLASREPDLKLENGVLTRTDTNAVLANGTTVNTANALAYIYGKMGYGVLTGDTRNEVNSTVRLSLDDNAYAVKVEAK